MKRLFLLPLFAAGALFAFVVAGSGAAQATSRYVSATGNDANACTQAAPCQSLGRAYSVAAGGDTVEVLPGTYPVQQFGTASNTKAITFHCQSGSVIRQLLTHGDNLAFDGCDVDGNGQKTPQDFSLVENGGGANYHFVNGRIGNVVDEKGLLADGPNMVIANNTFHDVVLKTAGVHLECGFIEVPEGGVFRNNTFTNCGVMDLFFKYPDFWSPQPPPYGNVTLDGNNFGAPNGTYSVYITQIGPDSNLPGALNGWNVTNNAFGAPLQNDANVGSGNTFCGNTGQAPSGWTASCSGAPPPTTTTSPTTTGAATTATTASTVAARNCSPDPSYASCQDEITALKGKLAQIHGLSSP